MQKYWINVVPKDRVVIAVEENVMQSQDDEAHLNRMEKGDWVIFYSPREDTAGTIKLQAFCAIGQIADNTIYPFENPPSTKTFRRKMNYAKVKEVPLIPHIQSLSFIRNKRHWGTVFKMNLIQIFKDDFKLISKEMGINNLPASTS